MLLLIIPCRRGTEINLQGPVAPCVVQDPSWAHPELQQLEVPYELPPPVTHSRRSFEDLTLSVLYMFSNLLANTLNINVF